VVEQRRGFIARQSGVDKVISKISEFGAQIAMRSS